MTNTINSEIEATYRTALKSQTSNNDLTDVDWMGMEEQIIKCAIAVLDAKLKKHEISFDSCYAARQYFRMKLQRKEREVFAVMFLNSQHQLIEYDEMFKGTVNAAAVYPREIAKKALQLNSSAMIIAHNHPSGSSIISEADKNITKVIVKALSLFEVSVIDHIIIAGDEYASFAEEGLL